MGIEDLIGQGKNFLNSDQGEDISDNVLDAGANLAKQLAPDELDAKIDDVRERIDGAIGKE
ncbi:hypothetical protein LG299_12640 [Microbacterium lacus]|uniref:hypothetical protein n=1 Tax=Microbacterium lacus TaxID=415217 RepID=UPI00384DE819